jgi:hypothetical protein
MPPTPIRVLIADDHRLFAEALEAILPPSRRSRSSAVRGTAKRPSSSRSR